MGARTIKVHRAAVMLPLPSQVASLLAVVPTTARLEDMSLSPETRAKLDRVLSEHRAAEKLAARGLSPMRKLLLVGPPGVGKTMRRPRLTRDLARELWDEVHEVAEDCGGSSDLFLDRLSAELQHVIEEPWDELQYEQTTGDHALRGTILPALIEACRARVVDAAAAPSAEARA